MPCKSGWHGTKGGSFANGLGIKVSTPEIGQEADLGCALTQPGQQLPQQARKFFDSLSRLSATRQSLFVQVTERHAAHR